MSHQLATRLSLGHVARNSRTRLTIATVLTALALVGGVVPAHAATTAAGTIAGHVTAESGIDVTAIDVSLLELNRGVQETVRPAADGTYAFSIPTAGDGRRYAVRFDGAAAGAGTTWMPGSTAGPVYDNYVPVASGQTVTVDASLQAGASLSGKITLPNGLAVADFSSVDVWLFAVGDAVNIVNSVQASADGTYAFAALRSGTYKVQYRTSSLGGSAQATNEWWSDKPTFATATPVTVAPGQDLTGMDVSLTGVGVVTGRVATADGKALPAAELPWVTAIDPDARASASVKVNPDGTFRLAAIPAGQTRLWVRGGTEGRYSGRWYGGGFDFESARTFAVSAGETRAGINVQLVVGAVITGKVSGAFATGSGDRRIAAWRQDNDLNYFSDAVVDVSLGTAAADGSYKLTGLRPGTYRLEFSQWSSSEGKAKVVYWGGVTAPTAAHTITVTAGQTLTGYDISLSKPVAPVLAAPTPKVAGTANVGKKLVATAGAWTTGTALTYRWYAGGAAIPAATSSAFTVTQSQRGKAITVKVTGTKEGFPSVTKTSAQTLRVPTTGTPAISGTAKVDRKLVVKTGTWTSGTTFTYVWKANGVVIKGATASSYTLRAAQVGKRITVTVTGKKTGYTIVAVTSAQTSAVVR